MTSLSIVGPRITGGGEGIRGGGEGLGVGSRGRSRCSMIRSRLRSISPGWCEVACDEAGEGDLSLSLSRSTTLVRMRSICGGGLGERSGRSMKRVPSRTRSRAGPRLGLRTRSREWSTTLVRTSSRISTGGGGGGPGLRLLALVCVLVTMRSLTTGEGDRGRGLDRSTVSTSRWRSTRGPASGARRASSRMKCGTRDSRSTISSRSRTVTSGALRRGMGMGIGPGECVRLSSRRS